MTAWALVVGINDYPPESGLTGLKGAVADAAEFADWLLDPRGGGVDPAHLLFWTHPAPPAPSPALALLLQHPAAWPSGAPDLGRPPRAAEIKQAAFDLAMNAGASNVDRLYVFFAGHGVQTTPQSYVEDPQNCFAAGDYLPTFRSQSLVPCDDLRRVMMRIGPAEVVLFFDCCRSPIPINVPRPVLGADEFDARGINVRCGIGVAAQPGSIAYETPIANPARGAFSKLLICGLRNLRYDQSLTAEQLENYVLMGIGKLVAPNDQMPSIDVMPKQEKKKLTLAHGPALGPPPELVIDLSTLPAGTQVIVRDPDLQVFQTLTADAEPRSFPARIGGYSLETPTGQVLASINHLGPEPTHVAPN
jgi:hypothetical protein